MIAAKELRIGNWVIYDNKYHVVEEIVTDFRDYKYMPFEDLEPIPISPEILESCGFVKDYDDTWYSKKDIDIKMLPNIYEVYIDDVLTSVENLHQLQNLYFALYAEEIEVKFPVTT